MSTAAIVMMSLAILLVWGGLALSAVHLLRHPDDSSGDLALGDRLAPTADLAAYDTTGNSADVADLRVALGIAEWNVYGVSYGSDLALQTVLAGRTALIIAHRLSTVEIADRVLVLEDTVELQCAARDHVPLRTRVGAGVRRPQNWLELVRFAAVGGSGYVDPWWRTDAALGAQFRAGGYDWQHEVWQRGLASLCDGVSLRPM